MSVYSLDSARQAASEGCLHDWVIAYLKAAEHRSLAAIIQGQRPTLEGPVLIPLKEIRRIAGPGPEMKYQKPAEDWEREISSIADNIEGPDDLPPMIVRVHADHLSVPDGNHRIDALAKLGHDKAWAILWHDSDPKYAGWWGPWPPEKKITLSETEPKAAADFFQRHLNFTPGSDEIVLCAMEGENAVAAVRLVPEFGVWTLKNMLIEPEYRRMHLGTWMLGRLSRSMEGKKVFCLAFAHLGEFYGRGGFKEVARDEMPAALAERYDSYQDEKGCLALLRNG